MNIQDKFAGLANLGAVWIMWLLVVLSVLSLAVIIERAIVFVSTREDIDALREELRKLYNGSNYDGARKRLNDAKSFEAQIIAAGLDDFDKGSDALEERLAGESRLARSRMERNLAFLGTVGNNAPFIGLLGTVIGVVRAFRQLNAGGQVSQALLTEIGEALIATAIGLLVALPAVAFFNYFQRLIKGRIDLASVMGSDLLVQAKSTQAAPPAAAASAKGA
jgi:biopolymer transport protein ExbB